MATTVNKTLVYHEGVAHWFHSSADIVFYDGSLSKTMPNVRTVEEALNHLDNELSTKSSSTTYYATITTNFTGSSAPYKQTISIPGIAENKSVMVDIVLSDDPTTGAAESKEYIKCISKIKAHSGYIEVICFKDKPTRALNIQLIQFD